MDGMHIDGLFNFRDTGGLPVRGGRTTRAGVLYRSDALSALTPEGADELAHTAVGVVVDMRTPAEQQMAPDVLPTSRPFTTVTRSILQGATGAFMRELTGGRPDSAAVARAMGQLPTLGAMYVGMLEDAAASFADIARLIAASADDSPTAVLVHCTAGKDRTGVATALMLEAAGVERNAVVADYTLSQENLAGPWAEAMTGAIAAYGVPVTPQLRTFATKTPPEAIGEALAWVDDHGGAADYLCAGGLSTGDLAALRTRIVA